LLANSSNQSGSATVNLEKLKTLAEEANTDCHYFKEERTLAGRKLSKELPLMDCFVAPCKEGCPIGQDIPEYMRLLEQGKYLEALELIVKKNPLPFITGTLCNHRCMTKCTRIYYDQAVEIRAAKLFAAQKAYQELLGGLTKPPLKSDIKVAIIGAGPAGLAAAYFLGKNGIAATVFDRRDKIGGIIEHIAPDFRIARSAINRDLELVRKMGAEFRLGVDGGFSVAKLKQEGFKYIFIAIGAWKPGLLRLDSDREVLNVLEFLEDFNKRRSTLQLGKKVAVIGAGNSAMDAARAAKRVAGVEDVYVVYRRTRQYMPAAGEELDLALVEGVEFKELLSPVSFSNGILKCQRMELGAPDPTGRRVPQAVDGEFVEIKVDTVIAAVGEKVDNELLTGNGIALDPTGRVKVDPANNETSVNNVFIGGDALRGPATIAEAIADGVRFTNTLLAREGIRESQSTLKLSSNKEAQLAEISCKKGVLQVCSKYSPENNHCLECNTLCNLCVEVCPNRANISIKVVNDCFKSNNQVLHMDGMCNECGNCAEFCPYQGAPYRDKLTLFWSEAEFADSRNAGFVLTDAVRRQFKVRLGSKTVNASFEESGICNGDIPGEIADMIWTVYNDYQYLFIITKHK
jgi:putative selenate reductase